MIMMTAQHNQATHFSLKNHPPVHGNTPLDIPNHSETPNHTNFNNCNRIIINGNQTEYPGTIACSDTGEVTASPLDHATTSPLVSDSEIIILQLKPSILYIILSSLGYLFAIAFISLLLAYATTINWPVTLPWSATDAALLGIILATIRIGWQALDWGARTYILTDRRIIVSWGIIRRHHFQASLFRIQHIAVTQTLRERLFGLGSIAFATAGSATYDAAWYTIDQPFKQHQIIINAIDRYGGHHPST